MKVFGARCLVREEKLSDTTQGGIVIPGREKTSTNIGLVIAVGDGAVLEDGTKVPMDIYVGDTVIYTSFSGSPISIGGDEVIVLNQRDVLLVVEPGDR